MEILATPQQRLRQAARMFAISPFPTITPLPDDKAMVADRDFTVQDRLELTNQPFSSLWSNQQQLATFLADARRRTFFPEPATKLPTAVGAAKKVSSIGSTSTSATIPTLEQAFLTARRYPGKLIYLDTKTSGQVEVAERMALQLVALLEKYPDMLQRIVIMNPDKDCLRAMQDVFARFPKYRGFRNFSLDSERLNGANLSEEERSPLTDSGTNRYVSIGDPQSPTTMNNSETLVQEVRKARARTSDPNSLDYRKKIVVWTINDPAIIEKLVQAGVDAIMTDDVVGLKATLDKLGLKASQRPEVIAHRGGPASDRYSENSLAAIEAGFKSADAIEIDICSAKDGLIVYHDNDPYDAVGTIRNLGLEADNPWRPTIPGLFSRLRGKRVDQLTIAQVQANFGFTRNLTHSATANLLSWIPIPGWGAALTLLGRLGVMGLVDASISALWNAGKSVIDGFLQGGRRFRLAIHDLFSGRIAAGLGGLVNSAAMLVGGIGRGIFVAAKSLVKGVVETGKTLWNGVKSVGKAIGKFFSKIF